MRDERVREARAEGFEYGKRGQDPRLCPYDRLSEEWIIWQRWHGFGTALREIHLTLRGGSDFWQNGRK